MGLDREDLVDDPIEQFAIWFEEAMVSDEVYQASAMCVSTIDENQFPDSRYVLLKDYDSTGLIFYTNLDSRKGTQLRDHNKIACNLYWKPLHRQIRIRGTAEQINDETADIYFASRPRGSQLAAWASLQSQPLEDRETLETRVEVYRNKFAGSEVPRPKFWSGYRVLPKSFEFWQSGANRMHDRFLYHQIDGEWHITRLYP